MSSCHAIALSSAGSNGAWDSGVIISLMKSDISAQFKYDVVAGVSTGALNTSLMSMFGPEDGDLMSEFLSDTW